MRLSVHRDIYWYTTFIGRRVILGYLLFSIFWKTRTLSGVKLSFYPFLSSFTFPAPLCLYISLSLSLACSLACSFHIFLLVPRSLDSIQPLKPGAYAPDSMVLPLLSLGAWWGDEWILVLCLLSWPSDQRAFTTLASIQSYRKSSLLKSATTSVNPWQFKNQKSKIKNQNQNQMTSDLPLPGSNQNQKTSDFIYCRQSCHPGRWLR